ncbi:type II toxin-antitoxin system RelE/ParE family toxin [Paraneptunicella aestuarii]|uniref:type II toxin-antitoxin system RelE/ParE family toxin n=1 Tax=Paraneptunicella aestuarii TaxID=2831148 RepID=UPI001E606D13|nr:type II toxin-antitoxin system RelE/ParE family toxin [Paraneptunicella aestuarii]UAA39315.1 type II toxin-antitoxin system RelE/ParE family toxin [Paraneptunicella aestuarii]
MGRHKITTTGREKLTSIFFHPDVYIELSRSFGWYESKAQGLGSKFISNIEAQLEVIKNFPDIRNKLPENFRSAPLNTFPYSIIYRKSGSEIFIIAITHQKPHPRRWLKRLIKSQLFVP